MRVLATLGIKGGVGKTAATVNLAALSAEAGARVLLFDLDPQGAATYVLRAETGIDGGGKGLLRKKGALAPHVVGTDVPLLDLLPADFSFRKLDRHLADARRPTEVLGELLAPLADDYDEAWLDCPAGLGLLVENAVVAADALVAPLVPAPLSVRTLEILERTAARLRPPDGPGGTVPLLPFLSLVDRRSSAHRAQARALHEHLAAGGSPGSGGGALLASEIPLLRDIEKMSERRQALPAYARRGKAIEAFRALWDELQARLT